MKKNVFLLSLATILFAFSACTKDDENLGAGSTGHANGEINGYEYVDLGLSVKWATCNVGASTPEEYGDYFAFGETSPKETYTSENSVASGDSTIGDIAGNPQYDAATANWGGSWRLPTKEEIEELLENCTYQWTTREGVNGTLFASKRNGNSIFLPAAGNRYELSLNDAGEGGFYWSATRSEYDIYYRSYDLLCGIESVGYDTHPCYHGCSVRPVSE